LRLSYLEKETGAAQAALFLFMGEKDDNSGRERGEVEGRDGQIKGKVKGDGQECPSRTGKVKGDGQECPSHTGPFHTDPFHTGLSQTGLSHIDLARPGASSVPGVSGAECKRLGEAVEAAFLAKATMLGFPVLKPWGDSRPYDFAVEGGRRLSRVQVKCATSHRGTRCDARAAGSGELYTLDDIDFLAAYVILQNLWYIVPADAFVPRATVHFNYGPHSQGMFEKYREAWCLLACEQKARGRFDVPRRCRCEGLGQRCVVCPLR